jgi:hypothetical protein
LLLHRSLLAAPIGQQTDLFRTDLRSTQPLEQAARRSIGPRASGQHGRFLQGLADGSSLELVEQAVGWTPPPQTRLTTKAPSQHPHPSEGRGQHPSRRSFQSALLGSTVWPRLLLVFPVADGLFQRLAHRLLPCLLDLLFHLRQACGCCKLDFERYLYLHERAPSVSEKVSFFFHSSDLSPVFQPLVFVRNGVKKRGKSPVTSMMHHEPKVWCPRRRFCRLFGKVGTATMQGKYAWHWRMGRKRKGQSTISGASIRRAARAIL